MRAYPIVLAILALVQPLAILPATSADAASFAVEVDASQEAPSGSTNSSDHDEQTTSTSPATASLVFSGSSNPFGSPRGTMTGSASATSRFDADGLELSVFATSRASGVTDGGGPLDYRAAASASASFLDAVTITGGTPGETGYIRAVFSLDGALTSTPPASPQPRSLAEWLVMVSDGGFMLASLSSLNGSAVAVPPQLEFFLKYRFDEEGPFSVSMAGYTSAFLPSSASNVTQTVDFGSSLRFVTAEVGLRLCDPGPPVTCVFQPTPGGQIISASGLAYPHGPLDSIVLSPASAIVAAGSSQSYTVEGFDTNGNSVGDVTAITTFSISPNGSCTGAACRATVVGPHTVTGVASGIVGTADLSVIPGPLHHLGISPASASITAGDSQGYTAEGFDAFNNSLGDVTGATTFSIGPNGSCLGALCTATVVSSHTVTGNNAGKLGTAALTVNPGPLDHIALSPASASTTAGGSQSYTARAFDAFNNSLGDVTGATTFSITPDGSCSGATCTATVLGPHTVTGNYGGLLANATFTIIPGPPRPDLVVTAAGNPAVTITFFGILSVNDTVKNQGTAKATISFTRYYLSLDQTRGGGDRLLLGLRFVGPLAVGQSSGGGATLFVFGIPAGTYYLLACADDTGANVEINEANNCLASLKQVIIK
jgi:hypothetical protein